jgi:aspartate/methionine/tyrosine aminotransferase
MHKNQASRCRTIEPFHVMALLQRAKALEASGRDIIHLEVGEPDFPTPPSIVAAATHHLSKGAIRYTAAAGLNELREKIAGYYASRYRVSVDPDRIFITPGASGAFLLAFGLGVDPGDQMLMPDPCYPCNANFLKLFNAQALTIPVGTSTRYHLTAELITRHWSNAVKGALIASPSNPTGTVINPAELGQIISAVEDQGGCFYSDEIYHGLSYGTETATALAFSPNVFVINSFSKYFGMTGWRLGWLIVPEDFIDAAERLAQNIFISAPTLSQYAALAAFDDATLQELDQRKQTLAQRRDALYSNLTGIGFEIADKPDGAFYLYANCAHLTEDSFAFAHALLEQQGVAITPGLDFGRHLAHQHVRFAYTTDIERMAEATQRIQTFINTQ